MLSADNPPRIGEIMERALPAALGRIEQCDTNLKALHQWGMAYEGNDEYTQSTRETNDAGTHDRAD